MKIIRFAPWQRLGRTGGYARSGKDYYVAHDRPKELWVWPLAKKTARRHDLAPRRRARTLPQLQRHVAKSLRAAIAPLATTWK